MIIVFNSSFGNCVFYSCSFYAIHFPSVQTKVACGGSCGLASCRGMNSNLEEYCFVINVGKVRDD